MLRTQIAAASDRHCERSEAIQSWSEWLDCFVAALLAIRSSSRAQRSNPELVRMAGLLRRWAPRNDSIAIAMTELRSESPNPDPPPATCGRSSHHRSGPNRASADPPSVMAATIFASSSVHPSVVAATPFRGRCDPLPASAAASDRHCERSEAIQSWSEWLDCFVAALVPMTERQSSRVPRAAAHPVRGRICRRRSIQAGELGQ
jgi:hypothetical protein